MARKYEKVVDRIEQVRQLRLQSNDDGAQKMAQKPHQFREMNFSQIGTVAVPIVTSGAREYLPCAYLPSDIVITNKMFGAYDAPLWVFAILSTKLHLSWVSAVCGKMRKDFNYNNTLGWNPFPIPKLTSNNIVDLTRCAEGILSIREKYFPKSIADLYDKDSMPTDLRMAHEEADEVVERIFFGKRMKNDSERLERLYDMYAKLIAKKEAEAKKSKKENKK